MSQFLMGGGLSPNLLVPQDERIASETFRWNQGRRPAPWTDGLLWPNSRVMGGDPTVPLGLFGRDAATDSCWAQMPEEGGTQTMKKIIGTTKDSSGAALGNCIVQGFLTANGQFLRQMTSDAGGYYEFCSEYSGAQHYLVAYKAGSPDVTGATANTLVPA